MGQWLKLDRLHFKLVKKYNTSNHLELGKAFTIFINLKSQPSKNSCHHLFCMFIRMPHKKYSGWGVQLLFISWNDVLFALELPVWLSNSYTGISFLISTLLLPSKQTPPCLFSTLRPGALLEPPTSWSAADTTKDGSHGSVSLLGFLSLFYFGVLVPFVVKFCSSLPQCTSSQMDSCTGFFVPALCIIVNIWIVNSEYLKPSKCQIQGMI